MKASARKWIGVVICGLTILTRVFGQESEAAFDQKLLNKRAAKIADLQKQIDAQRAEIVRILATHKNEHLVPPSEVQTTPPPAAPVQGTLDKLGSVLKIRQTLQDPSLSDLPAKLTYVHPAHGSDTIAADAGLDLNVLKALNVSNEIRERALLDAFVEYHKSSSASSPVDTLLVGSQFQQNLGISDETKWGNWLAGDASFKMDNVVSGDGFLADVFYYPSNEYLGINSIKRLAIGPGKIDYLVNPIVGFQYETGNGASSKFTGGDRVSFKAALTLAVYPFAIPLNDRLQWSNTLNYWSHVSTSGGFDQYNRNQFYFQSSLNVYFDPMKQIAVGVDYTNGDNLTTNQFDVNTWTFSLKAKFGK